jgi:hypothetical protein
MDIEYADTDDILKPPPRPNVQESSEESEKYDQ